MKHDMMCGAVTGMVSEMMGVPLDPKISAAICGYMTSGDAQGALYAVLGEFAREMMM